MRFDEQRRFGVEIEFTHPTLQLYQIAEKLRRAGIDVRDENYNHRTRDYWKLIIDSSCGYELVSPPIKGRAGIEEVRRVIAQLNVIGAQVNQNCGLHVHHEATDLDMRAMRDLKVLYTKYEGAIDELVAETRRGDVNQYCHTVRRYGFDTAGSIRHAKMARTVSDLIDPQYGRYTKLNFTPFAVYGTIEFRQLEGTLNGSRACAWIVATQAMINRSKDFAVSGSLAQRGEKGVKQFFKALQYVGPHQFKYQDAFARRAAAVLQP